MMHVALIEDCWIGNDAKSIKLQKKGAPSLWLERLNFNYQFDLIMTLHDIAWFYLLTKVTYTEYHVEYVHAFAIFIRILNNI